MYQAENRIAAKEMYITDPAISDFDFSPASLATLNELSFSDLVPSGEVAKSEPKNRSFKSSFFEYSHTKGK
ncbi:MAG: hypothetical protein U5L09_04945 [Bacteroidales bacterium]|nr:hypothetical protein [Bacteroidales bacterium]